MKASLKFASVILLVLASCSPSEGQTQNPGPVIVIASDLPLTGPAFRFVSPLRAAIELAIHDSASRLAVSVRYESLDDTLAGNWNPLKGEQNARLAGRDPHVLGLIGPYNSQIAQFEIPVASQFDLAMISPSNTLECLTAPNPCARRSSSTNNYFRLAGSDSGQAQAAAEFAVSNLHVDRFAVLDDRSDFGPILAHAFASELAAKGGRVVFRGSYDPFLDNRPILRDARAAGAEAVFVGGVFDGPCAIRSQMTGIFPASAYFMTGDRVTDAGCIKEAGQSADDHLLAMVSSTQPPHDNRVFKEFLAHGISPVTYSFEAYDAASILIDAIRRAMQADGGGVPSRLDVIKAIANTHAYAGVTGNYTFLPSGDPIRPSVSVYRVENGAWTFWQAAG